MADLLVAVAEEGATFDHDELVQAIRVRWPAASVVDVGGELGELAALMTAQLVIHEARRILIVELQASHKGIAVEGDDRLAAEFLALLTRSMPPEGIVVAMSWATDIVLLGPDMTPDETHALREPVAGAPDSGHQAADRGRIAVYGENERLVPVGRNATGGTVYALTDGFTAQYGAVGKYKHVSSEKGTWYIPDGLPTTVLREVATLEMDKTIHKLQLAADEVMAGDGVVEMTTNNRDAAAWIESRMAALRIRGFVRITS